MDGEMPEVTVAVVEQEMPASQIDVIEAVAEADTAVIAARADAAVAVIEAEGGVREAVAEVIAADHAGEIAALQSEVTTCTAELSELKGMASGLMTAISTLQEQVTGLLIPLSSEPIPAAITATEEVEPVVVEPETVVVENPVVKRKRHLI